MQLENLTNVLIVGGVTSSAAPSRSTRRDATTTSITWGYRTAFTQVGDLCLIKLFSLHPHVITFNRHAGNCSFYPFSTSRFFCAEPDHAAPICFLSNCFVTISHPQEEPSPKRGQGMLPQSIPLWQPNLHPGQPWLHLDVENVWGLFYEKKKNHVSSFKIDSCGDKIYP